VIGEQCSAHDYSSPGKPRIAWDDEAARAELVDALVSDALRLLGHLPDQELDARASEAVALLALIAGQDVEPVEGSDGTDGRWQIRRGVASDRVVSVVDPEARHAHKTVHRRQDGFKAHVAVEPETGIFTATRLTKASGTDTDGQPVSEARTGLALLDGEDEGTDVLADSAYGSGEFRAELAERKHLDHVKPAPTRPAVEGGFSVDDFTVDHAARTATCPAGNVRRISPKGNATFGVICKDCPLRARCTRSRDGKVLVVRPHDALQRAARTRALDPDWQHDYRQHRPMVERSLSWLVAGRSRKLRYRGVAKNDAWLQHRSAALNLRRLLNLGLIRQNGTWAIA
jgi:hypothetical protein